MVRWGESYHTGNWAFAGTNGGTNVIVLAISCGMMSLREQEVLPGLAGLHMLLTAMVHTGDTTNSSNRGQSFAYWSYIPQLSVSDSWLLGLSATSPTTVSSVNKCEGFDGNGAPYTYGGGHGFQGCGGHVAIAAGADPAEASAHLDEDWNQIKPDVSDATQKWSWATDYECNWDCWNYPMDMP